MLSHGHLMGRSRRSKDTQPIEAWPAVFSGFLGWCFTPNLFHPVRSFQKEVCWPTGSSDLRRWLIPLQAISSEPLSGFLHDRYPTGPQEAADAHQILKWSPEETAGVVINNSTGYRRWALCQGLLSHSNLTTADQLWGRCLAHR